MATERMVRVSSKGQIVLPKKIRDRMGIGEGDYIIIDELTEGVLIMAKSRIALFDAIAEPIRREAEEQGFTEDQLMDMIKEMRREPRSEESNAA